MSSFTLVPKRGPLTVTIQTRAAAGLKARVAAGGSKCEEGFRNILSLGRGNCHLLENANGTAGGWGQIPAHLLHVAFPLTPCSAQCGPGAQAGGIPASPFLCFPLRKGQVS
jgi:hypothetical protein